MSVEQSKNRQSEFFCYTYFWWHRVNGANK
jgi:hypothetical protein